MSAARRSWSTEEEEKIRARYRLDGSAAIGRELGRTASAVQSKALKLGVRGTFAHPKIPGPLLANPARAGTMLVPLTRGLFAVIDQADAGAVGEFSWFAHKGGRGSGDYAQRSLPWKDGVQKKQSLHRFLWELWGRPLTPQIDHKDLDTLNCTGDNLRAATGQQNEWNKRKKSRNTSGYKGIWNNAGRGWAASIMDTGRKRYLGTFATKQEAATVYAVEAARIHGQFARTT